MEWFASSLIGALFSAVTYAYIKKNEEKIEYTSLIGMIFLFIFIAAGTMAIITGLPEIGGKFYYALMFTVPLNVAATFLYLNALKTSDLSLVLPMLSFTPLFLLITSPIIMGEYAEELGIYGIMLIVVGSYVLHMKEEHGVFGPITSIMHDNGSLYMLIAAFLWSLSANYDKMLLVNSNVWVATMSIHSLLAAVFLGYYLFRKRNKKDGLKKTVVPAVELAVLSLVVILTINFAFLSAIVPYVVSVKRLSVVFGVVLGGVLFHERNIGVRLMGAAIMVAGSALIALA